MEDINTQLNELNSKFKKGEISFDDYSNGIINWNNNFTDILKAQNLNNKDASHGGKLHQKVVYDKTGKKVTKWVSTQQDKTSVNGKGTETPVQQSEVEKQYSIEDWEKNASKASQKALEKASKFAGSEDIRRIARNELLKRSFDLGKFMDLSLLPDFMLDNYMGKYDDVKLTPKENETIALYRDNDYYSLNKKLRLGEILDNDEQEKIKTIESAINKSELKHDITVYRGLSGDKSNLMFVNYLKSLQAGDIYEEPAFSSTSLLKGQAFKFKDLYNSTNNIVLKIFAPKGSKALCLQNLGGEDEKIIYKDEYEFLFSKDSKFQIIENKDNEISIKLV